MDPAEAAKKEAIATYQDYWQEMEKLYADRHNAGAALKKYAASAALENATADAKRAHDDGRVYNGDVRVTDPAVTKYSPTGKIPHVIISSCLDISQWQPVDADTEKPVTLPSNRLTKYLILSTVEKWPEGWRVIRDEPQDKPC
ncbi:secreted protein/lipoprotein [Streptomyces pilosus]|uniref:secreted protein/lipoprotein n=1 Tax=Streptomyces pilosus TaxID=28893 RepID=UPI0036F6DDC1